MQNELDFDIKKHSDIDKTFRVNKIMSEFKIDNKTADKGLKNSSSMGRRTASFTWRNNNG